MFATIEGKNIELLQGDITDQQIDAIVNAANRRLGGGGGVDGAIHRKAGPQIMSETEERYPTGCPTGSAVPTSAGHLAARLVFHAVGPIWRGGKEGEAKLLASAYHACMALAAEHDCRGIAFPALSAGAYGYPLRASAEVALTTTSDYLRQHDRPQLVRFVLFDERTLRIFEEVMQCLGLSE